MRDVRDAEEIMKAAVKSGEMPEGYNLIESEAFNAMRQLAVMFNRGEISKEVASKNRIRIYAEYEKEVKDFNFVYNLYNDYAKRIIKNTDTDRTLLRNLLKNTGREIKESDYIEALRVALNIIETIFPR